MARLTAKHLRELLGYDPETGLFRWRIHVNNNGAHQGSVAGSIQNNGYRVIRIDGRLYLAGRLAFLWMRGRWPKLLVDHENRNRDDNSWLNLREANYRQNGANQRNRAPVKGVRYRSDLISRPYSAQIKVDQRYIHLGYFSTAEQAHAAYMTAARKYFGEFASDGAH